MDDPITACVALPCILRSPASLEARAEGVTEQLTRDLMQVRLPPGPAAQSLRPGLALVIDIELPVADGRPARYLESVATVRSVQSLGDAVQVTLDVASMNFIAPRSAAGDPCRDSSPHF
jgi:hypothetical protein